MLRAPPERRRRSDIERKFDAENLIAAALHATTASALACQPFLGRGDGKAADAAATDAMRRALEEAPGLGTVVIGEGEKDDAPMLYQGEQLGRGGEPFDIAVDPLECTDYLARGIPGALATIAFAEPASLWSPGASFYMDKIVAPAPARDAIDITDTPERNLARVAEALGKSISELRVVVLDKPRHVELIARVLAAGASVSTPSAGDVAGSLAVLLPAGGADLLLGIGGTPEGVMTACAARALGGGMQGRRAPQGGAEAAALAREGIEVDRPLSLDELASSDRCLLAVTGVTSGSLLRGPWEEPGGRCTESIVVSGGTARRIVESDVCWSRR
ncbi:Fructose-16-bisphosphatase/sedoheptulose 1 [Gaiella occulta]|uniref:Fructose-1,6-bisphosphatase n=1 Tax=Gaiella occulta TaxID=1002870 RepID=A0A7M2Z1Z6_9ACTN|nr:fructose-bisphosphatase class II family protein [Gaiella occulta]RDI75854.1 Fructose-16-bisphosphatase/sedoheptulose 1 [Gaiella occulta]